MAILRENKTFRKIMEWGLKNGKKFGFNDWGKNIIIIHKNQHGSHPKFTERIIERIDNELPSMIEEYGLRGAYKALNKMLNEEKNIIINQVIKEGKHLDETIHKITRQ